jgi:hypothetical protein
MRETEVVLLSEVVNVLRTPVFFQKKILLGEHANDLAMACRAPWQAR